MTLKQIQNTIRAARDSVWVVTDEIAKLDAGKPATQERKGNIQRNVDHLKLVIGNEQISNSGEDISDLQAAITAGEAKIASTTWIEPPPVEE